MAPPLAGGIPAAPPEVALLSAPPLRAGSQRVLLATGDYITPDAAPGSLVLPLEPDDMPGVRDGFAVSIAQDGHGALALLTSGYNRGHLGKRPEHVYLYDVGDGPPLQKEVLSLPNAFWGLAFGALGDSIWVSGGSDDAVVSFLRAGDPPTFHPAAVTKLGHRSGLGLGQGAYGAGLAFTAAKTVVIANHENDSVSLIAEDQLVAEIDLREDAGDHASGDFPAGVVAVGDRAYVTCQRAGELVEVGLTERRVLRRVRVGAQPAKVVATHDGTTLFVADSGSDTVSVIDRMTLRVSETIDVLPHGSVLARGANPNAVALSPDEKLLFVSEGGLNAIAIVERGAPSRVLGFVPTGFYPNDVGAYGDWLYVAYGKSTTGPNVGGPRSSKKPDFGPSGADAFSLALVHGGLHAFPRPKGAILDALTHQVLVNARLDTPPVVPPVFDALRGKVKHVVFVVAENRTYDQVLGDVPGADGDPTLVHWGATISPNQHALATSFVTFDRFFASGGVSGDGWQWTVAGRTTDPTEKEVPLMYAARGSHTYDWEGTNRNINVGLPTTTQRQAWNPKTPADPRLLRGVSDVAAPHQDKPFLWDATRAAGLGVRSYGFFIDDFRYGLKESDPAFVAPLRDPAKTKTRVAFPTAPGLIDVTDPYFRGFDMRFPDAYRIDEWAREFDEQVKTSTFPALSLVRLPHDHFGSFKTALAGLDSPDSQMADHDWALGRLVERIAKSPFWDDTIVVIVEDDAQDGADHVDSHRSLLFFAGGHVARGAVVHTSYATPSVLRTVELLLGIAPLGRNDAVAPAISEAFTEAAVPSPFVATVPAVLRSTKLELPKLAPGAAATVMHARGDAEFWDERTAGMDFSHEDRVPSGAFNEALFCALVAASGCKTNGPALAALHHDDDDDDD
ncbi:hypothetical protein BH09MYX1_BH09MYX1_02340 [soil metagenome]